MNIKKNILFFDDQLSMGNITSIERSINALRNYSGVDLHLAASIRGFVTKMQIIRKDNIQLSGILLDLQMPQLPGHKNFTELGLGGMSIDTEWCGLQVAKILKHGDYSKHRLEFSNGLLEHFSSVPIAILSTNSHEDRVALESRSYGLDPFKHFWKDTPNQDLELGLHSWINGLNI